MIINLKGTSESGGGEITIFKVQDRRLNITSNGKSSIAPDEGYDGISTVDIDVEVPAPELEEKVITINTNGVHEITPETAYGMSKVVATVNADIPSVTEPISITSNGTYTPAEGVDGYNRVEVAVPGPELEVLNASITENGPKSYTPTKYGYSKVNIDVNVPIPEPVLEEKTVDITINGTETVTPTAGNDGISKITINTNVPGGAGKLKLAGTGIKFGMSTFTEVPEIYDFTGITNMSSMFNNCSKLTTIPLIDTSKATNMSSMFYGCPSLTTVPQIDTSKATNMSSMFNNCSKLTDFYFTGGVKPDCLTNNMFNNVKPNGTFFYNLPYNYDKIIGELPSTWKAQPLGDILLKIRVLKDTKWLEGDLNLTLNGNKLTYKGQGLYEISENITKENYQTKSTELLFDGVKIGDVKWRLEEQIIETGDNSSLTVNKVGADILTIVPEGGNADGWVYDDTVKGVKSAKISGGDSTTLKMNIAGAFDMVYGQDSEQNYDYAELKNGASIKITDFKGKKTGPDGQETYSGSTSDGVVQAVYRKDSGGDQGLDAFWIKSVTFKNLPPYPTV